MKIGVLGLQGDVREHARVLEASGATPLVVKHDHDLNSVDGLVLPGGESTTIGKLLHRWELLEPIKERVRSGMPLFGTCAGLILMATEVVGPQDAPRRLNVLDVAVRRNAYGRQVDSFESDLDVDGLDGGRFPAVFIRAPAIERVADGVEVLASAAGRPVLCRQGAVMAAAFHPELSSDLRLHTLFLSTRLFLEG